jgi:asparagine synthase (glutamine-hydrolysing)
VVLSGDGGDEIFGGYEWYRPLLASNGKTSNGGISSKKVLAWTWLALMKAGLPVERQAAEAVYAHRVADHRRLYPDYWDRHLAFATDLKGDRSGLWMKNDRPAAAEAVKSAYFPAPGICDLDRASDFDLRCYLPGDILVKVDRATMAHGLESRAPFLDVDLVEFVLSLPWTVRFSEGTKKHLLQAACSSLWPDSIKQRSKQGFGAPLKNWTHRPDIKSLLTQVSQKNSPLNELLPGARKRILRLSPQQQWTLLCLGLWLEKHSECLNNRS